MTSRITGLAVLLLATVTGAAQLAPIPHPDAGATQNEQSRRILIGALDLFDEQEGTAQQTGDDALLADAYGRLGMVYQALQFEDAALAAYGNALALEPDDPRWHHFRAFLYQQQGKFPEAIDSYRRVLELEPGYRPARVRLGLILIDAGRGDEAVEVLNQVLAQQADNAPAIAGLGRISMDAGDLGKAIEDFERALLLDPQANQLHYLLGLAYRQIGDVAQARTHMDQAGDRIPRIEDPWLVTMQVHSQTVDYYLGKGLAAAQAGQMRDAYAVFQIAALVAPRDPRGYVSLSRASASLGNIEAAGDFLNQALAIAPEDPNVLFNAGLLSDQLGDDEQAIRYYRQTIEQTPEFGEALVYLANALMRKGQYAEALDLYARASVIHQSTDSVLHLQALAYLALGECEQAMQVLEQALAINPKRGDVLQTRARTFATCPAASEEQKRTARADAQALYDLRPNLEHAATLAMVEAALGNFEDAADFQAQAMFESFKAGGPDKFPGLKQNMERYHDRQPALQPWPPGHPVFAPQPPPLTPPTDESGAVPAQ